MHGFASGTDGTPRGVVSARSAAVACAVGLSMSLLASCSQVRPYIPPSEGHIAAKQSVEADRAIPPPARLSTFVPQPKPTVKPQTYSVVVSEVPVKELLNALARDTRQNIDIHPALQGLGLDFSSIGQTSIRPTPLVTKTLLFMGEGGSLNGDPGGKMFRAYDKSTGAVVAEIELPSKTTGAPMTYSFKGRQYIVVAVATREHPAEYVALTIPRAGDPPAVGLNTSPADDPISTAKTPTPTISSEFGSPRTSMIRPSTQRSCCRAGSRCPTAITTSRPSRE